MVAFDDTFEREMPGLRRPGFFCPFMFGMVVGCAEGQMDHENVVPPSIVNALMPYRSGRF